MTVAKTTVSAQNKLIHAQSANSPSHLYSMCVVEYTILKLKGTQYENNPRNTENIQHNFNQFMSQLGVKSPHRRLFTSYPTCNF